jgi:hypothetical protein
MTRLFRSLAVGSLALFVAMLLTSCRRGSTEPPPSPNTDPIKRVASESLPPLGDPYPPLDGGRVELAPPQGWHRLPRQPQYLASFSEKEGARLPAIVVRVNEPPPEVKDFENVAEENVEAFSEALRATVDDPIEDTLPMMIGRNAYARYVKAARVRNLPAEVQVLTTVQRGRMYTIELQVVSEGILPHRDYAYAVAADMKFVREPSALPPESAEAPPPVEPDAS